MNPAERKLLLTVLLLLLIINYRTIKSQKKSSIQ